MKRAESHEKEERLRRKTLHKKIIMGVDILLMIVLVFVPALVISPEFYIYFQQAAVMTKGTVNSFDPKGETGMVETNGITLWTNIPYAGEYPNSFLDIYLCNPGGTEPHPTFFFLHGGGLAWGDKLAGDPTGEKPNPGDLPFLQAVCKAGYNVVSANYALAPSYRYPIPLWQVDQAVCFLQENAEAYGLDMEHIVFAGGSAGAQLAGLYMDIQFNGGFAAQMNMEQRLTNGEMIGTVLNCPLLDARGYQTITTGNYWTDLMYRDLGKVSFPDGDVQLDESNVLLHLNEKWPATYLTDGNTATFNDQSMKLKEILDGYGIDCEFNYYEEPELTHGYDSDLTNLYAQDNLEKTLTFLKSLLEKM